MSPGNTSLANVEYHLIGHIQGVIMPTLKEEAAEWTRLGLGDVGKSFEPLNLSIE